MDKSLYIAVESLVSTVEMNNDSLCGMQANMELLTKRVIELENRVFVLSRKVEK